MNLKKIIWIIMVMVLILSIFRIVSKVTQKKVQEERIFPVVASAPRSGEINYTVTLTGDIRANTEVAVRPRVGGRVEEIYVKEGDYVEKDQPLLSFVAGISRESDLYEDMIVRAPIAGVVGVKQIKQGEQVTSQPGAGYNSVFMLYDISAAKIYANVSEKDYSFLRPGIPADIRLDAYPDQVFHGRVSNIRPVIDPLSRTTQVEIVLPNPGRKIKPGMFAKVNLDLVKKSNVLIIPFDAVLGEEEKYVFVANNGQAVKKPVTLGLQQDENVEIKSGLSTRDKVIVLGERVIKEGSKIEETGNQ